MTKLQTIEAEIQNLPMEEQRELISKFVYLIEPEDTLFKLSEDELKDLDERLAHVDSEPTFTIEEVFKNFN